MKKKAFTLIELLVVIAIIAMLLAILMPALNKVKDIAKKVGCAANLRSLSMAAIFYADANDGRTPSSTNTWQDGSVKRGGWSGFDRQSCCIGWLDFWRAFGFPEERKSG